MSAQAASGSKLSLLTFMAERRASDEAKRRAHFPAHFVASATGSMGESPPVVAGAAQDSEKVSSWEKETAPPTTTGNGSNKYIKYGSIELTQVIIFNLYLYYKRGRSHDPQLCFCTEMI